MIVMWKRDQWEDYRNALARSPMVNRILCAPTKILKPSLSGLGIIIVLPTAEIFSSLQLSTILGYQRKLCKVPFDRKFCFGLYWFLKKKCFAMLWRAPPPPPKKKKKKKKKKGEKEVRREAFPVSERISKLLVSFTSKYSEPSSSLSIDDSRFERLDLKAACHRVVNFILSYRIPVCGILLLNHF